ncbi:hypothetical protein EN962_26625 [Mesorhizobium sp. M7A.F.Ca.CA.001.09.2.1]|uniref:Uncharacterized protein n=2 Tax=Mesorhizobium TaxID=68287 RepID=E8TCV5_MESCW|nr:MULTISPECIES: hypothetical protein [Mesorhizobium]RUU19210.1 hypothetical protein EOC84_17365 [Mesorhizobium sp. Primo-B]RUU37429.1 hypothetical protein EOC83_18270 [Mesorhizobium sp. Primo-A]RUX13209.1 hypothetical protein EN996_20975 [Mesorhizobium sp. M7A.F.Ca.CA.002.14.1.2]RUX39130.1 hypothetical protein EN987_13040 [Mesorhizobium sp. M7A.F.Ca.CA.002.11.2.1]RUX58668.1 hypothetical protein EN989_16010 [Mesorhizobium sp. M7A.F.Ca.CA.002.12.1.1]RUX58987.1 hypothetical protein EN994_05985 
MPDRFRRQELLFLAEGVCGGTSWGDGNYLVALQEEDVVKDLRSLLAELSANWLKRRKAQAPTTVNTVKPRPAHQATRQRAAHKPKTPPTRDVASNM